MKQYFLEIASDVTYTQENNLLAFKKWNDKIHLYVYPQNSVVYAYIVLAPDNAGCYKPSIDSVGKDTRGNLTVKQQTIASALSKDLHSSMDTYLAVNGYIKQEKGVYKFDGKTDMQRAIDALENVFYEDVYNNLWGIKSRE